MSPTNATILTNFPNELHVCSYQEFEPIIYKNGKGFEGDILRAVAALWNIKIYFHSVKTYEDLWNKPEQKDFDIAAGGITPQKDRKEHAIYSTPTAKYSQSLLVRKSDYEAKKIVDYDSFKTNNLKIGIVPASAGEKYGLQRAAEAGLSSDVFKAYKSESELLPALLKGEIAAIARGELGNDYQAAQNKELITIARRDFGEAFCFAVARDNKDFLKQLNEALAVVTDNGNYAYDEWCENKNIFIEQAQAVSETKD